jgi:beta-glucosidase
MQHSEDRSQLSNGPVQPFLWGVASSAFQIEGGIENDMTLWERDGGFRREGRDPRIGQSTDHWRRWEHDFELLNALGVNSYRFSLEWSRIEPRPGEFNEEAIAVYRRMLERLHEMGIVPMLTLHHFTHPLWFHENSPWHEDASLDSWHRYVEVVADRLLDLAPLVVTFNEPVVWSLAAYGDARFPPGERNLDRMMDALYHMLLAHRWAYEHIKSRYPPTQIGMAKNFIVFKQVRSDSQLDRQIKRLLWRFYNMMLPQAFRDNRLAFKFPLLLSYDRAVALDDAIDFWGINYYYRMHVRFRLKLGKPFEMLFLSRSGQGQSDLGWEIYPRGLYRVCRWLKSFEKPLYITENGIAAADDRLRVKFLNTHLEVLKKVIADGYPVRGYYHWSLLDNYEWLEGKAARFGLYRVDYDHDCARSIKPSGRLYRRYINQGSAQSAKPND